MQLLLLDWESLSIVASLSGSTFTRGKGRDSLGIGWALHGLPHQQPPAAPAVLVWVFSAQSQSVFQCGFPSTEPVPTLHLCTLGHRHRASTATSHQTPPLVFGQLVCRWGPGTAGISWKSNFGETMMVRRGCSVGGTRGAVWAVLQAPAGTPREDKPRVGLAVEPPRHGFFLPEPWGCGQGLLSSHSHDRHHPTESPEPAWGALGPSCLGEKILWIFSCCPGVTQTAGKTKTLQQTF